MAFCHALAELRVTQLTLLGIRGFVRMELSSAACFTETVAGIIRKSKEANLRSLYDKGHGTLHEMPSKKQLQAVNDYWWRADAGKLEMHVNLMNL